MRLRIKSLKSGGPRHGITHAVPVYEGAALQHGIVSHQIAGQDIEGVLSQLIQNSGATTPPPSALREMKEKLCFVPLDYDKEIASSDSEPAQYTLPVKFDVVLLSFICIIMMISIFAGRPDHHPS